MLCRNNNYFLLCVYLSSIVLIYLFPFSKARTYETKCRENDPAVKSLREFLRIDTTDGKNLWPAVQFLEQQAAELGLPFSVYYPAGKPIVVMSWIGTNSSLPSIMLNSHVDVVPAEEKFWPYPPFSAHIDENCNIHARGTQDNKSPTIQYIEAIRRLKKRNVKLQRTFHVTVMPDEETGGYQGIKAFVKTKEFKDLNIGFALDEGATSIDDVFYVSYQDKRPWQMKFTVFGEAGHGSGLPNSSAMEKMYKLLGIITKFREEQNELMKQSDPLNVGNYTSVNFNKMNGGYANNVVPTKVSCVVDMRLALDADVDDVQAMVESWRREAGNSTLLEFLRRDVLATPTSLRHNPYWEVMLQTAKKIGKPMKAIVIPATSDMLVLRNLGIPALGFAPRYRTPNLVHSNDEYINVDIFLEGISVYADMINNLGDLTDDSSCY